MVYPSDEVLEIFYSEAGSVVASTVPSGDGVSVSRLSTFTGAVVGTGCRLLPPLTNKLAAMLITTNALITMIAICCLVIFFLFDPAFTTLLGGGGPVFLCFFFFRCFDSGMVSSP